MRSIPSISSFPSFPSVQKNCGQIRLWLYLRVGRAKRSFGKARSQTEFGNEGNVSSPNGSLGTRGSFFSHV